MHFHRHLNTLKAAGQTIISLSIFGAQLATTHAAEPWLTTFQRHCVYIPGHGVLVSGVVQTFPCYLELLLHQNIPYVLLVAVVLVVATGIQYMLAQGNASEQGKAKQRIIGIVMGIIFYFLIQYLIPLISGGIKL